MTDHDSTVITYTGSVEQQIKWQLKDAGLRLTRAVVFKQNDFLMIRVENYCETELNMVDGLPVTTKGDKQMYI